MARDVISTCPVCEGELTISRLHCRSCGTALEGEFGVGRFGRLSKEQMSLLESFLRSRGNLKEMERELGISYPTVRGRVDALVRARRSWTMLAPTKPQSRRRPQRRRTPTWRPNDAPSWNASPSARSERMRPRPRCVSLAAGAERRGDLLPHPDD
jgi:hypothetical protein